MKLDSIDKIVTSYFAAVTNEPFTYQEKVYYPKPLKLSPTLLRAHYCPAKCAGCCMNFTLDFLPSEGVAHKNLKIRYVGLTDKAKVPIWTDFQEENSSHFCSYVNLTDGRCGIHASNPFSCNFEPLRVKLFTYSADVNYLGCYPFGRGWSYKTVDGGRGAKCMFVTHVRREEVIKKLCRLQDWTNHFGLLDTKIPSIISSIQRFKVTSNRSITIFS